MKLPVAVVVLIVAVATWTSFSGAAAPATPDQWEYSLLLRGRGNQYAMYVNGEMQWEVDILHKDKLKTVYTTLGITRLPLGTDVLAVMVATSMGRDGWEICGTDQGELWLKRRPR